jgi:hypothetical protein
MAPHQASRSTRSVMTVGVAALLGIAGCSSSGGTTGSSPSSPVLSQPGTQSQPSTRSQPTPSASAPVPIVPLKKSKFFYLTKLSQAQLCGLLHGGEPSAILKSPAGPPTYANTLGLGVVCTWSRSGGSGELYMGISTVFPWRGAQPLDKFAGDKPTTIDGHPADAGKPNSHVPYATAHVAIAGLNDPVVEFRAPTLAEVLKLARAVLPRLLAIKRAG